MCVAKAVKPAGCIEDAKAPWQSGGFHRYSATSMASRIFDRHA
jgi:hypothetical protein